MVHTNVTPQKICIMIRRFPCPLMFLYVSMGGGENVANLLTLWPQETL